MKSQSTKIRTMNRLAQSRACLAKPCKLNGALNGALVAVSLLVIAPLTHAASCSINSVPPLLNFGSYDPLAYAVLDGTVTATISITCNATQQSSEWVTVTMSLGTGPLRSYNPRKMQGPSPSDTLDYNLYVDSGRNQVWGDGTGGTSPGPSWPPVHLTSGNPIVSITQTISIYGRIFAGQDPAVGNYSDSIVYTLNF